MQLLHKVNIAWNNCFRKISNAHWWESVKPLSYYTNTLPASLLTHQRKKCFIRRQSVAAMLSRELYVLYFKEIQKPSSMCHIYPDIIVRCASTVSKTWFPLAYIWDLAYNQPRLGYYQYKLCWTPACIRDIPAFMRELASTGSFTMNLNDILMRRLKVLIVGGYLK